MISTRILVSAAALACGFAFTAVQAQAKSADYRFELVGKPQLPGQKDIVQVRLVHVRSDMLLPLTLALMVSQASVAECEVSPKGDIHVIAAPNSVKVATDFSLDQIADLARQAGSTGHTKPLGFYVGRFLYSVSLSLEPARDGACRKRVRIDVAVQLTERRIEIGRELEQAPCLFAAALHHYDRKARADEGAFAQYVSSVAATLGQTALPPMSVQTDEALDTMTRTRIEQWVRKLVDQSMQLFTAARVTAQQAVDTPDEMRRLAEACSKGA